MIVISSIVATAFPFEHLVEVLKQIPDMTWTPEVPAVQLSREEIVSRLMHNKKVPSTVEKVRFVGAVPAAFDWVATNSACMNVIRNQANCGSCWAFSAIGVLSDQRCLKGKDATRVQYSEQYVVSCDKTDMGCDGGYLDTVWTFLQTKGTVLDKCYPYTSGVSGSTGTCKSRCKDLSAFVFTKSVSFKDVCTGEESMKSAITEGPLTTGFTVYEDFQTYKSGIYQHVTGAELGGHAVEYVGYGEENGVKFWKLKNSWGATWGEKGYFRMIRGVDDCGIEDSCMSVVV